MEFITPEGLRMDGRKSHELRRCHFSMGVLSDADGSAYVELGNTKVLATVYGPKESALRSKAMHDRALVNCTFSLASFSTSASGGSASGASKSRRGGAGVSGGDKKAADMAKIIKETFESTILVRLYPRSEININVEILQGDGGHLSAALNACTLGVVDAGIPMLDYTCSCSAGFIEGLPVLDINYIEETAGGPELVLAVTPKSGKIVVLQMGPRLHADKLRSVVELASKGCMEVAQIMDQVVKSRTRRLYGQQLLDEEEMMMQQQLGESGKGGRRRMS
eukprot:Nk52_evm1s1934 gene=Nk52_evmTU1s1934